ncbi:MAG: type II toxin-antitoxin system RelE/ParE family toxin [Candidatus Lokiarchaeota archaeon]|nr:type II toxin-antitoxin system RelE/ParE family toxin [Candidatus Lokiarchaeota archaeon]
MNDRIFESIENLESFPKMGRKVHKLNNPMIRELILQNYRIIYKYNENNIIIITISHGSRKLHL